jgi:Zn-dependent metalloprotease
MSSRHLGLLAAAALLMVLNASAWAFVPVADRSIPPIPKPGMQSPPLWRTEPLRPDQHPAAALFEARVGSGWRYQWNALTGTPHAVFGPGVQISRGPLATEAEVEAVARAFVLENRELLGVDPAELQVRSIVNGLGKWGVIFNQVHAGVEVEDARLRLLMTESGRLYYFGSDWHPHISAAASPAIGRNVASDKAGREVGFVAGRDAEDEAELRILPVPEGEALAYRLVWRVRQHVADPFGIWVSYVDARDAQIRWRYDDVHYVDVSGTTRADVEDFGYCYGEQDRPMPNMKVSVTGGGSSYSDQAGAFSIANGGSTQVTVTAQLDGRWINVNDALDGDATFTTTAIPGVPLAIRWTDTNANDAERDAYLHGNRIHDLVKHYDPTWTPPDYRMTTNVNINNSCNAYWDGSTINFYRAGGGCGNTGQMGDVIYHEYGHGITQWIYGGNPDDVGEGNSDIAAFFIDNNPIVGEGFYLSQCSSGIRTADNTFRYPDDYVAGSIHANGQIVSGFWWDARANLLATYGEEGTRDILWPNWHMGRRTLQPTSMPDQVMAAFLMDDDDGDLTNGTPHYYAFCPAAEKHGFLPPGPVPVVSIDHGVVHNQVYDGSPDVVRATITSSAAAIDPASVKLRYSVDGGSMSETPMTATGNPNEYAGTIPVYPVGSSIEYAIVARDANGNGGADPPSYCAPDEPSGSNRFYIVTILDEMETATGWTVGAPGDNATTGIWVRVDPTGTAAQPEDDKTPPPGVTAWITGQCAPGCGLGDNDVDGGTTTLLSPLYDLSSAATAKVIYYRWYSNDTGATPGTDFWVVDASNDSGTNWVNVENTNLSDASWMPVEVDLNTLFAGAPGLVKFRFVASDLAEGSLVEAGLDEFMIMVDYTSDAAEDESAGSLARFHLAPARPNPFGEGTDLVFDLPAPATVTLRIYDVAGRVVRTLADQVPFEGGSHVLHWDGRDQTGRESVAGVYYLRLLTPGFSASRKLVLQR